MENKRECHHCGSKNTIKNGSSHGKPRYKCKICKRGFGDIQPKFSRINKQRAVFAYFRGLSIRGVADVFGASPPAVLKWIRKFHKECQGKLEQAKQSLQNNEKPDIIELDEVYTCVKKSKDGLLYGQLILENKNILLLL